MIHIVRVTQVWKIIKLIVARLFKGCEKAGLSTLSLPTYPEEEYYLCFSTLAAPTPAEEFKVMINHVQ